MEFQKNDRIKVKYPITLFLNGYAKLIIPIGTEGIVGSKFYDEVIVKFDLDNFYIIEKVSIQNICSFEEYKKLC